MMTVSREFGSRVREAYANPETVRLSKSILAHGGIAEGGHPLGAELELGESRRVDVASLFLDLSDFTGRSFWDDPVEVARLADATLAGFTWMVHELGGHVLGLRGDGLYAGFGPWDERGVSCALAAAAAAGSLKAVEDEVNPWLESIGVRKVQARAGMDFGEVTFTRTGITASNEVNVVGFSANFAAKSEKYADAWEVVAGQNFVAQMEDQGDFSRHEDSPKEFQRDYQREQYHYYRFAWRRLVSEVESTVGSMRGRALDSFQRS